MITDPSDLSMTLRRGAEIISVHIEANNWKGSSLIRRKVSSGTINPSTPEAIDAVIDYADMIL